MRRPAVLFLLLCAMGAPALAEEAPRTVQAFEETIDVQAVNFEAVVTDSRGRRVTGLTAEDFKLFIDGIETPITFFSPVDDPVHASGSEPSAQPSWQSRHILVFLDESTMLKARRNLEGTFARFRFSVDVGKRSQRVAITVHDALSGEALWGEALLETQEQARKSR